MVDLFCCYSKVCEIGTEPVCILRKCTAFCLPFVPHVEKVPGCNKWGWLSLVQASSVGIFSGSCAPGSLPVATISDNEEARFCA